MRGREEWGLSSVALLAVSQLCTMSVETLRQFTGHVMPKPRAFDAAAGQR
jgi:hypothetical protein